ncbi:CHAP domain-containing protein [Bifidobacterium eulemuris]|uniref:Amidase n=1 Tax=Bifidobacterium eulemuris TaxID=1765219 RepID=A0A261GA45_9BIFI|nr:CHAP domain-containing protein [Bifidobacterium eulemuris]OZG68055.1 amidase [Bifidobacterium eulemuris]QOL31870.1 CHAP domain-containing protein [Bifidobacterium eulemuris]
MKHAAHKATAGSRQQFSFAKALFSSGKGSHCARKVRAMQVANGGVVLGLDPAVAEKLNEVAPLTRRSIREAARAAERRNIMLSSASLAALVGTAATAMAFANPDESPVLADASTTTTQMNRVTGASSTVSRSEARESLSSDTSATQQTSNEGDWQLGDTSSLDTSLMSRSLANNPVVAALMDEDYGLLPDGFDPNHAVGTESNQYPWGQCTWYVYQRRAELGLPTSGTFGNAGSWGVSASALGYWVDGTARHTGDVVVFAPGQESADSYYGHVAVVEKVNADGSIEISESNAEGLGVVSTRTFTAEQAAQFTYIHY